LVEDIAHHGDGLSPSIPCAFAVMGAAAAGCPASTSPKASEDTVRRTGRSCHRR
jgi:hypothetical protein